MPNQVLSSVENNFTKGLVTEFTGLNFPENAATDTSNCIYTVVGDVTRREGFDLETHHLNNTTDRTNKALSDYKWNNVGGTSSVQVVVTQIGGILYFYNSSAATLTNPLSNQILLSTVNVSTFVASGGTFDATLECQYSDGNGYLFVYHPSCDPFFCTYTSGTVSATVITVQIRDFTGITEPGVLDSYRPPSSSVTSVHQYNLNNQGWGKISSPNSSSTNTTGFGIKSWVVASVAPLAVGDRLFITSASDVMTGVITAIVGTTLTVSIITATGSSTSSSWSLSVLPGYPGGFAQAAGAYPSNSDVWWYFKDSTGVFNPSGTLNNVTLGAGPAPKGFFLLKAWNQDRSAVSGVPGLTVVSTTVRPKTGTWFQGRVWYTGVDAPSFTESIYFSQVVSEDTSAFGKCYQTNDPTSSELFGLLSTDGGVIKIQGSGSIYKLFPLQNALIVFAANGVWYLTGSQGIGFTANDYTIVKLSSVRSISSTSVIDVQGLPMFWNEEGIYSVEPAKQGTSLLNSPLHVNPLEVNPITVGTILSFYNNIPLQSKKYVRGDYNPIDYLVQWSYRSTNESSVTDRYQFDSILNYNNFNKAFYPYSLPSTGNTFIHGVRYVSSPGGSTAPSSTFKYLCSTSSSGTYAFTFAEENSATFNDWFTVDNVGINFISYFVTGFKLHGQGQRRFQIPYIYVFSRADEPISYKIQGLWDYATDRNSNRWSVPQMTNNFSPRFGMIFRRHRIRGQGIVLQIKVSSADGQPFDIMGWSSFETQNTSV